MFAMKLGLRNLTRQKRRNMITVMVIAYAFFAYLLMDSVMNGMEEMSFENIRDLETGNIQIVHSDYWEEREDLPLENLVYLDQNVEESLKNINGLSGISPELRFIAYLNNGIDELPVLGLGIDPDRYQEVFTTGEYLVDGSMFSLGENKGVLGEKMAQLMNLKINDYITLLVRTKEDTFNTIDVEIAGIVNSTHPMVNSGMVFVPLDIAQRALNVENRVSLIAIKVNPGYEESVTETLNQNFKGKDLNLKAYSWRESAETVIALSTAKKSGIGVVFFVVLLIGLIGIINNVVLSALERTEEIGLMKALGMKEMEIVSVFMVEATGIGIIGGLIGCLLGAVGVGLLTKYGFDISYAGDMANYGIPILNKIYGIWNFSAFYFLFILGVIVALFSSIIPALWAARKDPVKAIYHR
jgi:putative ABC transport system permease protein